jgi:hypothetical protein
MPLCMSLIGTATKLLNQMTIVELKTIRDLQLLTLGAQLRGGQNVQLGKDATAEVFSIIEKIVHDSVIEEGNQKLVLLNAAGRNVIVTFSSDPDIAVNEQTDSMSRPLLSIEIKGGTDISNIHNRMGEAEKSHQKAKRHGFFEFWTIIGAKIDIETAKRESQNTSYFFYLPPLRKTNTNDYKSFKNRFQSIVGIKTSR